MLISTLFVILLSDSLIDARYENAFTRSDGLVILLVFSIFIYYLISMMKNKIDEEQDEKKMPLLKALIFTVLGIVMIVFGSDFVVDSASQIARAIGISEKMIALTIIALGTSLPELVTSITATKKGEYDIAIGNVVGSNIFNLGVVVGIPVAIFGGIDKISFNSVDLIVFLVSTVMLFFFSVDDRKITRKEGIIFLLVFIAYYSYVICMG